MSFNRQMAHPYCGVLLSNKRNRLLIHTITWMDLQGIVPSEISQSPKIAYYVIPFIEHFEMTKF